MGSIGGDSTSIDLQNHKQQETTLKLWQFSTKSKRVGVCRGGGRVIVQFIDSPSKRSKDDLTPVPV